jgi:hypothetical protein
MVLELLKLFDGAKPLFQAVNILFLLVTGILAARAFRSRGFLLIAIACFVSLLIVAIYMVFSLQTEWRITLLPVEARRVMFLVANLLYLIEIVVWPLAVFFLLRERQASGTPPI